MTSKTALAITTALALSVAALSPADVLGRDASAAEQPATVSRANVGLAGPTSSRPDSVVAGIPWSDLELDEALERGREEGRKVFAVFHATWCGPCKRLSKEVFRTAEGERVLGAALPLRLDVDDDAAKPYARKYRVRGLPTSIVFEDGKVIGRIRGFPGRDRYLKRLRSLLGESGRDSVPSEPSF